MSSRACSRRTPKRRSRGRHVWMRSEDDLPLSLLALIPSKKTRERKKTSPRKRVARGAAAAVVTSPTEIIDLVTPESSRIQDNVNTKIGNFLQSGSFISSDEDETEMIKAKTNKKPSPNPFFISDDSDDDCKMDKQPGYNYDLSEPSTSTGISTKTSKKNVDDDLMVLVDSVLDEKDSNKIQNNKDLVNATKSLDDFRKKTEEMLKNASCLLDEFKSGSKVEESSPKITVGSCPVCLESLSSRPAAVTVCGHIFCKECITHTSKTLKKCPTCRKAINNKKIHPIYF